MTGTTASKVRQNLWKIGLTVADLLPLWMLKQFQNAEKPEHLNQWITVSEVLNEVCILYCSAQGIMSEDMNYRWDGSVQGLFNYCWLVIKGSARRQHVLWRQWQHSNAIWRHWMAEVLTLNIHRYSSLQTVPRTTQLQTVAQTIAAEYCVAIFARTYKCPSLLLHRTFCSLFN